MPRKLLQFVKIAFFALLVTTIPSLYFIQLLSPEETSRKIATQNELPLDIPNLQLQGHMDKTSLPEKCNPYQSVYFLKTHKCASTTVQRIFLRYGWNNGLSFALPVARNFLGSPKLFSKTDIARFAASRDNRYDMFVFHARLNTPAVLEVMKKGSPSVTIFREPSALFESLWNYFDMHLFYGVNISFFSKVSGLNGVYRREMGIGLNQMMFDLGFQMPINTDPAHLLESIQSIDDFFDLVMISERFDESLVLLRHLLCWSTEDIAYVKLNFRSEENASLPLPMAVKLRLRKLNYPDAVLYDFFRGVFNQKVKAFGKERMAKEVKELKEANEKLFHECFINELEEWDAASNSRWENRKVVGWKLKNKSDKCRLLTIDENSFAEILRNRQTQWRKSGWKLDMTDFALPNENEIELLQGEILENVN